MDGMCIYIYRVVRNFCKKIFLRENIIVNITAYSVNIFIDTFLIGEIKNMKILFSRNLVSQKFRTIRSCVLLCFLCRGVLKVLL